MQFIRNHSTRDFLGTTFFGLIVLTALIVVAYIFWLQSKIPIGVQEPLSLVGVGIMFVLFVIFVFVTVHKFRAPWYTQIICTADSCTFTARHPNHTLVIKKTDIVSAAVQQSSHPYGRSVGVLITYTQAGRPRTLCVVGHGSWRTQTSMTLRQKKFCEALVAELTL